MLWLDRPYKVIAPINTLSVASPYPCWLIDVREQNIANYGLLAGNVSVFWGNPIAVGITRFSITLKVGIEKPPVYPSSGVMIDVCSEYQYTFKDCQSPQMRRWFAENILIFRDVGGEIVMTSVPDYFTEDYTQRIRTLEASGPVERKDLAVELRAWIKRHNRRITPVYNS